MEQLKTLYSGKPLPTIKVDSDFPEESYFDALEIVNSGVEVNTKTEMREGASVVFVDVEQAAKYMKENMDKKFGPTWQCVVGEGMSFDINYQEKSLFFGVAAGNLAILLYKS